MAQMNRMEKRNFTNSARNGGKTAEMRNNSAKSGMVGMSEYITQCCQQQWRPSKDGGYGPQISACRKIFFPKYKIWGWKSPILGASAN